MSTLIEELKELIIATLALEDVSPADIDEQAPLFGDGLGLDSIDALELGVALKKTYSITLEASDPDTKRHFASVVNLARFVAQHQEKQA